MTVLVVSESNRLVDAELANVPSTGSVSPWQAVGRNRAVVEGTEDVPESSTLKPSRSPRPSGLRQHRPPPPPPRAAPRATSSRLRRSTVPKVTVVVVKTRERGVSRAYLATAAGSMRTAFAAPMGPTQSPKSSPDPAPARQRRRLVKMVTQSSVCQHKAQRQQGVNLYRARDRHRLSDSGIFVSDNLWRICYLALPIYREIL
jgi:hypothetical protein